MARTSIQASTEHQGLPVVLIVAGSIWIMSRLSQNMMLMDQLMRMQP